MCVTAYCICQACCRSAENIVKLQEEKKTKTKTEKKNTKMGIACCPWLAVTILLIELKDDVTCAS